MHYGQNRREEEERKFSKKTKLNENREAFIHFVEIGGIHTICMIDLRVMDAPEYTQI